MDWEYGRHLCELWALQRGVPTKVYKAKENEPFLAPLDRWEIMVGCGGVMVCSARNPQYERTVRWSYFGNDWEEVFKILDYFVEKVPEEKRSTLRVFFFDKEN